MKPNWNLRVTVNDIMVKYRLFRAEVSPLCIQICPWATWERLPRWLFIMRDMFGDKAAAYATYKWVIVGHVATWLSIGQWVTSKWEFLAVNNQLVQEGSCLISCNYDNLSSWCWITRRKYHKLTKKLKSNFFSKKPTASSGKVREKICNCH